MVGTGAEGLPPPRRSIYATMLSVGLRAVHADSPEYDVSRPPLCKTITDYGAREHSKKYG